MTDNLFNPEAFEQMAGQMSMEQVMPKDYYVTCNVGKVRYAVNFHDGVKTHADGSRFYDLHIARNKRELGTFVASLRRSGYTERGS